MPMTAVKSTTTASTPPHKRLFFNRRYGWVFCIVPLAKELFQKASESINFVGGATLNVIERPDLLSPKAVQATISDQMCKIAFLVENTKLLLKGPKGNNEKELTSCSSDFA